MTSAAIRSTATTTTTEAATGSYPVSRTYKLTGKSLATLEWGTEGAGNKPTVLMLHGWLDNAASFHRLAPALAADFHCIALDWPGHGLSDWRADYPIWAYPQTLIDFIDRLGRKVHIIGHSMGAASAVLAAPTLTAELQSLTLIDAVLPMTNPGEAAADNFRKAMEARKRLKPFRSYSSAEAALAARLKSSPDIEADSMCPLVERNLKPATGTPDNHQTNGDTDVVWRMDPALRLPSAVRLTPDMATSFAKQICTPTLAIHADNGLFRADTFQAMADSIPTAKSVSLAGHHHLHLDSRYCDGVIRAVRDFLESGVCV